MFIAFDYGAQTAGTTALCYLHNQQLVIACSLKNKKADEFVINHIKNLQPQQIFIDAPLSLPKAYYGRGNDFHFRKCDRELKAMSPMFLGGLTARAIALKNQYQNIQFFEAYPKMLAQSLDLKFYKKDLDKSLLALNMKLPYNLQSQLKNWHEFDAVLAWYAGYKYQHNKAQIIGDPDEGIIVY